MVEMVTEQQTERAPDQHCYVTLSKHPQEIIPSPNSRNKLIFMCNQKKEPPISTGPKTAETGQPFTVLHAVSKSCGNNTLCRSAVALFSHRRGDLHFFFCACLQ